MITAEMARTITIDSTWEKIRRHQGALEAYERGRQLMLKHLMETGHQVQVTASATLVQDSQQMASDDEAIRKLKDAQANAEVGLLAAQGRIQELEGKAKGLEVELATARASEHNLRRSGVIEGALKEGRIFPVNRAFWESQYDKDPEGTAKVLEELPRHPYFEEIGTGAGGEEEDFTPADAKVAEKLQLTPEDYRKFKPEKPRS